MGISCSKFSWNQLHLKIEHRNVAYEMFTIYLVCTTLYPFFVWNGPKHGLIWLRDHLEAFSAMCESASLLAFFWFWSTFLLERARLWLDITIGDNLEAFEQYSIFGRRHLVIVSAALGIHLCLKVGSLYSEIVRLTWIMLKTVNRIVGQLFPISWRRVLKRQNYRKFWYLQLDIKIFSQSLANRVQ